MSPKILISRCFAEVTPESAENGDFSDHGFVFFSEEPITFRELVDLLWSDGFYSEGSDWLTTGWHTDDYATGTDREETLHFSRSNPAHLEKYWNKAIRAVEAKRKRLKEINP